MEKNNLEKKENINASDNFNTSLGSKFLKKKHEKILQSIIKENTIKENIIKENKTTEGSNLNLKEFKDVEDTKENKLEENINNNSSTNIKPLIEISNKTNIFQKFFAFKKKFDISNEKKNKESKDEKEKNFSDKELIFNKKKKRKVSVSRYEHIRHLKEYLEKAGYTTIDESKISQKVNIASAIIVFLFSIYLMYSGLVREDKISFIFSQILLSWIIILPTLIVIFWVIFYVVIDFKIYNRRKELEEVLPDFLQLTSANINAGMPLDQALWYAVRPRFGILAKEIEDVAKSTIVGEDLGDALLHFSKRYDSPMLKRTINLMLEGLDAGGEIGPLLNKISTDIQETRLIKKDMAANVTTYVIFISFATIMAAPFLFALSNQLLSIIQSLITNIKIPQGAAGGGMLSLSFSSDAISMANFRIFAISTLTVTSFFSAVIISTIRYGNAKDGIKYIPIFIISSIIIYLFASSILGYFLGGII